MAHLSSQSVFPSFMALSSHLNSLQKSFSLPFLPQSFTSELKPSPLSIHSTSSQSSNATTTHRQLPSSPPLTPSHPPLSPTFTGITTSTIKPYRLCTLCHHRIEGQEYSFPSSAPAALAALKSSLVLAPERTLGSDEDEGAGHHSDKAKRERHFCRRCWIRIYDLSLCWTCGEVVHRGEERVGFGWCWWHWGCVGCLFCRVCFFLYLSTSSLTLPSSAYVVHLVYFGIRETRARKLTPYNEKGTTHTTRLDRRFERDSTHQTTPLQILSSGRRSRRSCLHPYPSTTNSAHANYPRFKAIPAMDAIPPLKPQAQKGTHNATSHEDDIRAFSSPQYGNYPVVAGVES